MDMLLDPSDMDMLLNPPDMSKAYVNRLLVNGAIHILKGLYSSPCRDWQYVCQK